MRTLPSHKVCRGCGEPSRDNECELCWPLIRELDARAFQFKALAISIQLNRGELITRLQGEKN